MNRIKAKTKLCLILLGVLATFILLETGLNLSGYLYSTFCLPKYNFKQSDHNVYRILCFGDSFTYGLGAGFENSYPVQLEEILNRKAGSKKFKVFNLGVPGYNSSEVTIKLIKAIKDIKPDVAIVLIGENDLWNYEHALWKKMPLGLKIKTILAKFRSFRLSSILFENVKRKLSERFCGYKLTLNQGGRSEKEIAELIKKAKHFQESKEYAKAAACYRQTLMLAPGNKAVALELGHCYKFGRRYDQAIDVFLKLLRSNPEDEQIHYEIKDVLINQDDAIKTLEFYTALFQEFPENKYVRQELSKTYVHLGGVFLLTNQMDRAVNVYKKALDLDPQNKQVYLGLQMAKDFQSKYSNSKFNEAFFDSLTMLNISWDPYVYRKNILYNNLKQIVKVCQQNKAVLIFSGYPLKISDVMQEIAQVYNIVLVDHRQSFNDLLQRYPWNKYFVSGYDSHCLKEGYRVMAENIAAEILDAIEYNY